MLYLLDTDIYIYLATGNQNILDQINEVGEENIYLSSITVAELYYGSYKSNRKNQNLKKLQKNLEKIPIHNFTKHAAKIFGRLKAQLNQKGHPIHDMDLAIASIALHNHCILVTHNTKHFSKIPDLIIEDWA